MSRPNILLSEEAKGRGKKRTAIVLLPLDGRQRGGEAETDSKLPGVALQRKRQTDKDGAHGQERGRQQTTASSGGKMFGPCCASWNKES